MPYAQHVVRVMGAAALHIYPPVARHTHVKMEKTGSKRSKRSPSFTPEEMAVLVDEVSQHRDDLFGGTKGKKNAFGRP